MTTTIGLLHPTIAPQPQLYTAPLNDWKTHTRKCRVFFTLPNAHVGLGVCRPCSYSRTTCDATQFHILNVSSLELLLMCLMQRCHSKKKKRHWILKEDAIYHCAFELSSQSQGSQNNACLYSKSIFNAVIISSRKSSRQDKNLSYKKLSR